MASAERLKRRLSRGLEALDQILDDDRQSTLLAYLDELQRWNRSYNLTAVRDPLEMVTRHLLDSLAVLPWIGAGPLLDAGTGAGLPGVPLAIARPELQITLLDSAGKKVRFLNHVRRALRLENVHPVQARLEAFAPVVPPAAVISRAFASLGDFAAAVRAMHGAGSQPAPRLLAMKGRAPRDEIDALPPEVRVDAIERLVVPGLQEDRHLVIMSLVT
ncbi:MAG: 16S rRNA (guanine(527)-N(7))-methyltransferase RsmG [Xanthomonadales bacterium]